MNFYKKLKTISLPITQVLEEKYFSEFPPHWHVIISDVKNSTAAVTAGRHNDVNLVAAGSLIAALNVARAHDIEIPFFFGGDGGTLIVPEDILPEVITGLQIHNVNSIKNFGLEMHIGSMPVKEIIESGHFIRIAKTNQGSSFHKALIIGDGLQYAEKMIKSSMINDPVEVLENDSLNLTGLECRWDRIKPPEEQNEVVCYLVEAVDPAKQLQVFKAVLSKADEIYGSEENRNPLSIDRLKLLLNFQKIRNEMMAKYGKWKIGRFILAFFKTFIGKFYFRYNLKVNNLRGRAYLAQLISNADTLIVDGRINTIISGKMDKRLLFTEFLNKLEKQGELIFGHHISNESVMTCYIQDRNAKHIHFVDGADGGYTEASRELKRKLQIK